MTTYPLPVGILGVGVRLPDQIRRNEDWPKSFVDRFAERRKTDFFSPDAVIAKGATPAEDAALERMATLKRDPFRGSVERRVLPRPLPGSVIEVPAVREAVEMAGVDRREIGLMIHTSIPSDYYAVPTNGTIVASALELPDVLTFGIEAGCAALLIGVDIAARMIACGTVRYAVVFASLLMSRLVSYEQPSSVNAGDGAAAVVVGPVDRARGILSFFAKTEPSLRNGLMLGSSSGAPWYDGGEPVRATTPDTALSMKMVLASGDYCREAMTEVLGKAKLAAKDVDAVFMTQPAAWFSDVCRMVSGLKDARTVDTFPRFATVGAASTIVNLAFGLKQGLLTDDDVVALYGSGAGFNRAAMLIRWGR